MRMGRLTQSLTMGHSNHILSILSHVSHGYVGNRVAVFILQCLGWDVDALHTTDFLNHPGYGSFAGTKVDHTVIEAIFKGLREISDMTKEYRAVLVGYCPSVEVMDTVYSEIEKMYDQSSDLVLVVDPVLGDNGRLYVPQAIVAAHTAFLEKGLVDLTTPNQFELEVLTGVTINDWASVKEAFAVFFDRFHTKNLVCLSIVMDNKMFCVGHNTGDSRLFSIEIPQIHCRFSGCGDVFTALLTDLFLKNGAVISPKIVGDVLTKLHQILLLTYESELSETGLAPEVIHDVRLVQLRHLFEALIEGEPDYKFL